MILPFLKGFYVMKINGNFLEKFKLLLRITRIVTYRGVSYCVTTSSCRVASHYFVTSSGSLFLLSCFIISKTFIQSPSKWRLRSRFFLLVAIPVHTILFVAYHFHMTRRVNLIINIVQFRGRQKPKHGLAWILKSQIYFKSK